MSRFDVAIVGAGPAGAWAGRRLALAGARTLVVDGSHPREKPCGGGLTGRALRLLADAGIDGRVPGVAIRSACFSSGQPEADGPRVVVPLSGTNGSQLVVVSRATLDSALIDSAVAAGAEWRHERVRDIGVNGRTIALRTRTGTIEAGFLIGADGANSLVRRRLLAPFSRGQLSIASGFYARGVTSSEVAVHCVPSPPGYIWSFPRTDHTAIGICAQADATDAAHLRGVLSGWARQHGGPDGAAADAYNWPIPSLRHSDFDRERPAGERWALVGDAAGLVDPLTREGIYFALRSGEFAADALLAGDADARYRERLHDEVYPELARAAALKAGFFTSRFTDLLVEALGRSEKVRAIMGDLVAGSQPYATLKGRLIRTLEVSLAWRLLKLHVAGLLS
jgi:geranylgeranyl reductase family protein